MLQAVAPLPVQIYAGPLAQGAPTRALASFAAGLRFEDIPGPVVERAKELLLDYLSTVAAVAKEDPAQRLIRFASKMGGPAESRILGAGVSVAAPWAALVNGTMGHMMELDDTDRKTMAHAGDSLWASALAVGERQNASGAEILAAAIAGYEVSLRIGESVMPDHYRRGWHPSGTFMPFGAAVAAGRLLGLDAQAMGWALGNAGAQASGNFAHLGERAMTKDFNCGHAAKCGVIAALLAAEGFTGPTDVVENRRGFMALYGVNVHPERLTAGLGAHWRVMDVSQKAYSGCRYIHPSLDIVTALQKEVGFRPEDVKRVVCRLLSTGAGLVNDPVPWDGSKGLQGTRFSLHFNIAVALQMGREGLWSLLDERHPLQYRDRPEIRAMMARIEVIPDAELDKNFPDKWSTALTLELSDGRSFTREADYPTGEPENPMAREDLLRKFDILTEMAGWSRDKASGLPPEVARLDRASDLSGLLTFL
ncbi:MmgE/PrpD family protein [Pigmentiphaga soli]|uniref:MmgE/PrpD family protein n=1 Tax=Pigmentiphaga soli TaxID=1007095 RepID=A0ABP8GTI2_9BURK